MKNKKDRIVVMSGNTMSEMLDELDAVKARLTKAEEALARIMNYDEDVEAEDCPILRGIARSYFYFVETGVETDK
jgi:hypothetical protein